MSGSRLKCLLRLEYVVHVASKLGTLLENTFDDVDNSRRMRPIQLIDESEDRVGG